MVYQYTLGGDSPVKESVVFGERFVFDSTLTVRCSAEIRAILAYWTARYPVGHERHFSSSGHFVRAAVLYFDRVQRRLESGELVSLSGLESS